MNPYANTSGVTILILLDESLDNNTIHLVIKYCLQRLVPVGPGMQLFINSKTKKNTDWKTFLITGISDNNSLVYTIASQIVQNGGKVVYAWAWVHSAPFGHLRKSQIVPSS